MLLLCSICPPFGVGAAGLVVGFQSLTTLNGYHPVSMIRNLGEDFDLYFGCGHITSFGRNFRTKQTVSLLTWRCIIIASFLQGAADSSGVLPSDMRRHTEYLEQLSNATFVTWSHRAMAEHSCSAETDSGVYTPFVPCATVLWWSIYRTRVG